MLNPTAVLSVSRLPIPYTGIPFHENVRLAYHSYTCIPVCEADLPFHSDIEEELFGNPQATVNVVYNL